MQQEKENYLTRRIQSDLYVPQFTYLHGLLDIVQFLCYDLKILLEAEGRYFGIMPVHMKRIDRLKQHTVFIQETMSNIN